MTCHCGAQQRTDIQFLRDSAMYGITRQRLICTQGHTTYDPPPVDIVREFCSVHTQHAMPCAACDAYNKRKRQAAGEAGGRGNRGKHSGSIWRPKANTEYAAWA